MPSISVLNHLWKTAGSFQSVVEAERQREPRYPGRRGSDRLAIWTRSLFARRWPAFAVVAVIALTTFLAYLRTFSVPLIYDDVESIENNTTIRHFGSAFFPPTDSTVSGRPLLNVSFALNYWIGGLATRGYHAVNLAIHIWAALILWGIVRRTMDESADPFAPLCAFSAVLLWALHPLDSESITYLSQRAESLAGLLYLLVLYCFISGVKSEGPEGRFWFILCVLASFLGVGVKEVIATVPLVVLLYDRTFIAGSFRRAWSKRWTVYMGLGISMVALAVLVWSTHGRSGTAGFGGPVSWWVYGLFQLHAITRYIALAFWPRPLIFDYGMTTAIGVPAIVWGGVVLAVVVAFTIWGLIRRSAVGFLGACFLLILAPSSSIVPIATEPMAEHRMYLPLFPIMALLVLGIYRLLGFAGFPVCLLLSGSLFVATCARNEVYASNVSLWSDTVAKRPNNERAQIILGNALAGTPGGIPEAIGHFETALRNNPNLADAHNDLAAALAKMPGRLPEAIEHYEAALRIDPSNVRTRNNLGNALARSPKRLPDAVEQFEAAIRLNPNLPEIHNNLGVAYARTPGRVDAAIAQFETAVRINLEYPEAQNNLGNVLVTIRGRLGEAIAHFRSALKVNPNYAEAHFGLACALLRDGEHDEEARAHFQAALHLKPAWRPLVREIMPSSAQ